MEDGSVELVVGLEMRFDGGMDATDRLVVDDKSQKIQLGMFWVRGEWETVALVDNLEKGEGHGGYPEKKE